MIDIHPCSLPCNPILSSLVKPVRNQSCRHLSSTWCDFLPPNHAEHPSPQKTAHRIVNTNPNRDVCGFHLWCLVPYIKVRPLFTGAAPLRGAGEKEEQGLNEGSLMKSIQTPTPFPLLHPPLTGCKYPPPLPPAELHEKTAAKPAGKIHARYCPVIIVTSKVGIVFFFLFLFPAGIVF